MASDIRKLRSKLRDFALGLPEVTEDLPWGERVAKVNKKVFVFLGRDMDAHFGLGVKLPKSNKSALGLPFTEPTAYGLGKSGWVSAKLEPHAEVSFELLRDWVIESYCAVASKTLAARAGGEAATAPAGERTAKAKAIAKVAKRAKKTVTRARAVLKSKAARGPVKKPQRRAKKTLG
jgi:predicted DNA-binding protein (MmcQ/YjbR family)